MVTYYVCGAFMYSTLYAYLICMYWAVIYKDMGIVVWALTRN